MENLFNKDITIKGVFDNVFNPKKENENEKDLFSVGVTFLSIENILLIAVLLFGFSLIKKG